VEIVWLGHSCFRIRGKDVTIVTDPFDRSSGYTLKKLTADVVCVSHLAPDHANIKGVGGNPQVVDGPGEYEIRGALITGVATRRDGGKGNKEQKNTAYLIEIDDLTVCHLGDLGHILTSEQVEQMNSADVLMIPVGGNNTINASQAAEVVSQIEPKIVIPMHYQTEVSTLPLDPVGKFLREMGVKDPKLQQKLNVSKGSLPEETTLVLLDYKH
jgi:L-ascorbate metabolism protein UlaG (beta-lactamase superfamily)